MNLNDYVHFCSYLVSVFPQKNQKKNNSERSLLFEKANFQIEYQQYLSVSIVTSIISALLSIMILLLLSLFVSFNNWLVLITIPVILGFSIAGILYIFPNLVVKNRQKEIDRYLPFAVNYLNTMAKTNIAPVEIFHSLSTLSTYGCIKVESLKIVKEVKMMGVDNITALKHAIDRSPSEKFKGFLQGLIGTIQAGSSLTTYLSNMAEYYMKEDLRTREKNLESLSLIAELFVIAVIAFPIFLIIIVTVFGFIGETSPSSYDMIFYISFIVLPLSYLGFFYIIKTSLNDDFKSNEKQDHDRTITAIYKEHRTMITILGASSAILASFLITIFILFQYNYIPFDPYYLFDIIFISILILIGPYSTYCYLRARREKEIRNRFPDFLVDMGNSLSSGMSVFDSIHVASKGNYGIFTDEVKKMKIDLSWRIPIRNIFSNLSNRLKNSIIDRTVTTINKGLYMGGGDSEIFKALASEVKQINQIDEQRNIQMTMYLLIIIISFVVFLFIMIILNNTLFAYFFEFQQSQQSALDGFLVPIEQNRLHYALYSFTYVQSIGAGLLGGFMKEGSISPGLRYSFVLGLISIILFQIFL